MPRRMLATMVTACFLLLSFAPCNGQEPEAAAKLKQEIERLRVSQVAWRHIPWNPCLSAGLHQAKEEGKPALLWVFIDRPADDARC
ncbi:MAG: hypothetical protein VYE64_04435 [Planctomycetota bacterium]|nr:hypothetical protein [Planctomycetota bacterium]